MWQTTPLFSKMRGAEDKEVNKNFVTPLSPSTIVTQWYLAISLVNGRFAVGFGVLVSTPSIGRLFHLNVDTPRLLEIRTQLNDAASAASFSCC